MMHVALDSSLVIDLLRGSKRGVRLMEMLESEGATFHLPSPVLYEVALGFAHLAARHQQAMFDALAANWHEAPFTDREARAAAEIQADLAGSGKTAGDLDAMVAGIAQVNRMVVATCDREQSAACAAAGVAYREA